MSYIMALSAALLFAVSVPAGKLLLVHLKPLELSAFCYLGSGIGLAAWRALAGRPGAEAGPGRGDLPYLAGFVLSGGVLAPLALFTGLNLTRSSSAAMLLNFELVFTSLIAIFFFREHGGRRFWTAAVLVTAGGLALAREGAGPGADAGALLVLAAGFFWAVDNNLTARVSIKDPVTLAAVKGLAGGLINAALILGARGSPPEFRWAAAAMLLGLVCYGFSLVLFILAMRGMGASRAGAFFGAYPFMGAALSVVLLGEPVTARLLLSGGLMLAAFVLLAAEKHSHAHSHEPLEHDHGHTHSDGHHWHVHAAVAAEPHSHLHTHAPGEHAHPHLPDAHHRHRHA